MAAEVFSPDDKKDANADYHPGGRNLMNSAGDLAYLKATVEKWEGKRKEREELDAEAEKGFENAMGKE
jgi:hypothetical protein